ncbi:hypothetical protein [Hymenobacter nivis]|uniref:Lipoprotein n=1 Tax=Hymenobacter nivis TaxID=1850093 RepID=A0A502GQ18_9BACT|nr:hypothetical protein [Hymenobacter nivis]TPG63086.1 hypothetical protein EAH73_18745 [Hymenobacter nivis]
MRPNHLTILGALAAASTLAGCQPTLTTTPVEAPPAATAPAPAPPTGAPTAAAARAAIGHYLEGQPNALLYVVDSARTIDLGSSWQVLVPRTDWARRMPNRAAFEVDKQTGSVKSLLVK